VKSLGITIEVLAPEVEEVVMEPMPEVVVEEQVVTGVHQSRLQPDGEAVSPSPYLHDASLTSQKRVLLRSLQTLVPLVS
jgi:hypothetical protein